MVATFADGGKLDKEINDRIVGRLANALRKSFFGKKEEINKSPSRKENSVPDKILHGCET